VHTAELRPKIFVCSGYMRRIIVAHVKAMFYFTKEGSTSLVSASSNSDYIGPSGTNQQNLMHDG
jgi:hypothetical protein